MLPPTHPRLSAEDQTVFNVLTSSVRSQESNVFEIGLVLGGTVSSGAYTAGFLDKLIEALDCWYLAKNDPAVPQHHVKIRVATGASGGAVCAAILARALAYKFPHITPTTDPGAWNRNPFYKTWVEILDAAKFLDTSDIKDGEPLTSFFNAGVISGATTEASSFKGEPLPNNWTSRPYVDNPFHVIVTLANLTGVPYAIDFGAGRQQSYLAHADYARFACDVSSNSSLAHYQPRPDEFFVRENGTGQAVNWATLGSYAQASGAFPLAFPPGALRRPRAHYDYRAAVIPGPNGEVEVKILKPCWDANNTDSTYAFLSVDGGTFNNEPIELARTFLTGLTGRTPRNGSETNRALIMVDPLSGSSQLGASRFENLFKLGGSTLSALIGQSRYSTADLMLMADPDVYSRFLVTPQRDSVSGDLALATSGLDAFMGFFEKEFRRHDYMLGRANCHAFLEKEFVLPQDNLLFAGQPPAAAGAAGPGFLPIIPLVGRAAERDGPLPWPQGKLTAKQISKRLKGRLEKIIQKVLDDAIDFPLSDFVIWALKGATASPVLEMVEKIAEKDLRNRNL